MYLVYPYDKSIFQIMRTPLWALTLLSSLWPLYGVQVCRVGGERGYDRVVLLTTSNPTCCSLCPLQPCLLQPLPAAACILLPHLIPPNLNLRLPTPRLPTPRLPTPRLASPHHTSPRHVAPRHASPRHVASVHACSLHACLLAAQPLYYLLVFTLIDRTDEFQLSHFILELKAYSCISLGFLLTAMGAAEDHVCISWSEQVFCEAFGPGRAPSFPWESILWLLQAIH